MRRRARSAGFGALVVLLAATVLEIRAGGETLSGWWAFYAVYSVATVLVLGRALTIRHARRAWFVIGVGMFVYTIGMYFDAWASYIPDVALQPPGDVTTALLLSFYPLTYLGVGLLLRHRVGAVPRGAWLDGAIGGLAVAALATSIVFAAVLDATSGSPAQVAANLAYPLGDALLLASLAGALSISGWRLDPQWGLMTAGVLLFALGDSAYLYMTAVGTYDATSVIDLTWPLAFSLLAFAAWRGRAPAGPANPSRRALMLAPVGFGLLATGILVNGSLSGLEPVPAALAGATLVAVLMRLVLAFRENVNLLERTSEESVTDDLTGLANRRRLRIDLDRAVHADAPQVALGLFDLNAFKAYNDVKGHLAGDALLARLGSRLAKAVEGQGKAYRLGGDEFCVLLEQCEGDDLRRTLRRCDRALTETGEDFSISASVGVALVPEEAAGVVGALALADERMYAAKRVDWVARSARADPAPAGTASGAEAGALELAPHPRAGDSKPPARPVLGR